MNKQLNRLTFIFLGGLILIALVFSSIPASAGRGFPSPAVEVTDVTNTPGPTPTAIPPGLRFTGWSKGCTSGPYITCSATVTSAQTDPYRWDFDITYTYNDNRTNMGSNFTLYLAFDTQVFYTGVPIWWEMYPTSNEVMPTRWIDVAYSGVSDLNPMDYPSGSWTIPSQPSPYDTFRIRFSRLTGTAETLVRTDSWHVTVATYDYHALTPTPTPTATPTSTPTFTPTLTVIPTFTPTPIITNTPMPTVTPTYSYGYLGSGYFPTNILNFCNTGAYNQQTQNAASRWSIDTDINMFDNCTTYQINVIYADFGVTQWVGRAHICNESGQCDNSEALNSTYFYCQVWLNSDAITGNPFFYTEAEVQKLIMHELGHCFSLDHSTDPTSVMSNGSVPNAQDIIMINARY